MELIVGSFLMLLVVVLGIGLLISLVVRWLFGARPPLRSLPADAGYQLRERLLSPPENALLDVLDRVLVEDHYRVFCRVPLLQLVAPTLVEPHEQSSLRRLMAEQILDLVICRASDSHPLCVVALGGGAEPESEDRRTRRILLAAGLEWVDVPRRDQYEPDEVEAILAGHVLTRPRTGTAQPADSGADPNDGVGPPSPGDVVAAPGDTLPAETEGEAAEPAAQNLRGRDGIPLCPRCYAPMTRREPSPEADGTVREAVWECSRYPRCATRLAAGRPPSGDANGDT